MSIQDHPEDNITTPDNSLESGGTQNDISYNDKQQDEHPSALIIGATGAVGRYVASELIDSDFWDQVVSISRREAGEDYFPSHPKFHQVIVPDFGKIEQPEMGVHQALETYRPRVAFCCLGTTQSDAGSAEAFELVDYDYVVRFAQIAQEHGITDMHVISSWGASASSWFLYPRTKGRMENAIKDMKFNHTHIFQPGLLGRDHPRLFERIAAFVSPTMQCSMLGCVMVAAAESLWRSKKEMILEYWNNTKIKNFYQNHHLATVVQKRTHN